jgi:uncharacterized protein (TIGR00297 family)
VISVRLRKLVHLSLGLGALALPFLTWWQSVTLAMLGVVVCALALPGMPASRFVRGYDSRLPGRVMFYALGVLLLLVTFPTRPDLVAVGWGILAGGDGAATVAGRAWGGPRWAWNRDKSLAGSAAFVVAGATMGFLLGWAVRGSVVMAGAGEAAVGAAAGAAGVNAAGLNPAGLAAGAGLATVLAAPPSLIFLAAAALGAALLAAIVETLPIRLDDNLSVSASAAIVLWCATLVSPETSAAAWPILIRTAPIGVILNTLVAVAVWRAGGVSASGAIAGAILGALIYAGTGWRGWLMLVVAFGAAWSTSKIGLPRKRVLGIEEAREGRRGAENAIANCGLAAVAALAALFSSYHDAALLALTAALTAGASDTVASEIGKAWGGRTVLVTTLASVPPGTPGAMSLEGTAAGLAAAFAMGLIACLVGLLPFSALWIVVVSATAGALVESALAATLERHHILDNNLLNFLNTLVAAVCAVWLA